ncbi:hypothetical protein BDV11DRAFT_179145 [Aspergillus similis]
MIASSIIRIILYGHPTPFQGALTLPEAYRFWRIYVTSRLLQLAAKAISALFSNPNSIIC